MKVPAPSAKSRSDVVVKPGTTSDEATEKASIGRTQYILFLITGMLLFSDAAEVAFLSYVADVLRCDWGLSTEQESRLTSVVFLGVLLGLPAWGRLADHTGRRPAFLASSATICVFRFLVAACQNVVQLVIVRGVVGFGVAGLPIGFEILAEAFPISARDRFLLHVSGFLTFGSIYVTLCARTPPDAAGWRILLGLPEILAMIAAALGCASLQESPRWLCGARLGTRADVAIEQVKTSGHCLRIATPTVDEDHAETDCTGWCAKGRPRPVKLVAGLLWFAFGASYYGIATRLPRALDAVGGPRVKANDFDPGCFPIMSSFDFQGVDLGCSVMAEMAGLTLAVLTVDKPGLVSAQALLYASGGACAWALGSHRLRILLTCAGSATRMPEMAASCSTLAQTAEFFPTRARTAVDALLVMRSKTEAFLAPWLSACVLPEAGKRFLVSLLVVGAASLFVGVVAWSLRKTAVADVNAKPHEPSEPAANDDVSPDGDDEE